MVSAGEQERVFTGDHLAYDLAAEGGAVTQAFLATWLGLEFAGDELRPLVNDQIAPLVFPELDNPVFSGAESWLAYNYCQFDWSTGMDAVTALPTAHRLAQFADPAGFPGGYPYSAATLLEVPQYNAKIINLPYDLMNIRDDTSSEKDPASLAARALLLGDVLTYFGVPFTPDYVTDVPGLGPLAVSNYPNPFNPRTRINFNLPRAGRVSLKVFNVRGGLVRTLLVEKIPAGPGEAIWDGNDGQGAAVSSGLYFYEFRALGQVKVGKMTLVR